MILNFSPLIVGVIGAVLALARWRRHPKVSFLMISASIVLIIESLIDQSLIFHSLDRNYVHALAEPFAWLILIAAGVGWRRADYTEKEIS